MKKIITFFLTALLLASVVTLSVSAGNGNFTMTGAEGKPGDTVTVKVNLATNPGLTYMQFRISWDAGLELTGVADTGVLAGWVQPAPSITSPYTILWMDSLSLTNNTKTGQILTLTFKISETASIGAKNVQLTFSDAGDSTGNSHTFSNASATVKVVCAAHNFGASTDTGLGTHVRSCAACGYTERPNHTWDAGTVTKNATCAEEGNAHYKCTACGAEKDEVIAKTADHAYTAWIQKVDPKCTTAGEKIRTCSVCQKDEKQTVAATGHNYGEYSVILEPTLSTEGMKQRKCKECNHTDEVVIPCTASDEQSGVSVQAATGDLEEGTEMKVSSVETDSDAYKEIRDLLADIGGKFETLILEFANGDTLVQPKNPVSITVKVPAYEKPLLYLVSENGELTKIELSAIENGTATFTSSVVGTFVFVDEGSETVVEDEPQEEEPEENPPVSSTAPAPVTSTNNQQTEDKNDNNIGVVIGIVLIVILVLAAGGVSYWFFFIKKK